MPLRENDIKNSNITFAGKDKLKTEYIEDYPNDQDFSPDSELHKKLLKDLMKDAIASYNVISQRFPTWKELDEKLTTYVDLSTADQKVQSADPSKPVAIVVPMSYATRETLLTYRAAAFLQNPIFRYEASRDPRDTIGVLLLENIVEQHMIRSKGALSLHTMWSDDFTYGVGGVATGWKKKEGYRTREIGGERIQVPITMYAGSELIDLDPYNMLTDPNVSVTKVQEGNFFGWTERSSYTNLLREEKDGNDYFNVKYLKHMANRMSTLYYDPTDSGRYSKQGVNFNQLGNVGDPCDIMPFYKWIIPSDYSLGDNDYPELWKFTVAADRVIIEAGPLGLDHNEFPVALESSDSDGHTTLPVSVIEREYPLQHAIDWLWQSHVANVRKAINNMFVIDPSLIDINDVIDTKFGMLARMRPSAWGRGVKEALEQLPVSDVTQNHVQDIGFLMKLDSLVFTSDQAKGYQNRQGERVSAQESRDTRLSFLSKMEKSAKLGAIQAHYDIAHQVAANTIQLLEDTEYVKITGEYEQVLRDEFGYNTKFVEVKPNALDVRYDVIPNNGDIQGGEFADTWVQLLQIAGSHPETFEGLDFVRTFKHVARLLGAKNVNDFMKNTSTRVASQDEIEQQTQAGNFVTPEQLGASF